MSAAVSRHRITVALVHHYGADGRWQSTTRECGTCGRLVDLVTIWRKPRPGYEEWMVNKARDWLNTDLYPVQFEAHR